MYSPLNDTYKTTPSLTKHTDQRQPESHERGLVCADGGVWDRRTSHIVLLSYYSLLFVCSSTINRITHWMWNSLTLPYKTSIRTKQQQIFDNENLVGISIPVLETSSNGFQVRNEWQHPVIATDPPTPIYYLFRFSDVYYLPLSSFPTQQIHSSSQQHQTHVPPSIPFPSDNPYPSSNLTGFQQPESSDAVRTQPWRWRWCVHRRRKQPTIARRGPEFVSDWIVRRIFSLLWTNRSSYQPTECRKSLRKRRQWPLLRFRMPVSWMPRDPLREETQKGKKKQALNHDLREDG